jgi:phosphoheptose isomerase
MPQTPSSTLLQDNIAAAMEQLGGMDATLATAVSQAAALAAEQLVAGHKLYVLATPELRPLAQLFCDSLVHRNAANRPPLPVLLLNECLLSNNEAISSSESWFRHAQSLLGAGDALLVLSHSDNDLLPFTTDDFASSRQLKAICLQPGIDPATKAELSHTISLSLENTSIARIQEITLFILNCLSAMIDHAVFSGH